MLNYRRDSPVLQHRRPSAASRMHERPNQAARSLSTGAENDCLSGPESTRTDPLDRMRLGESAEARGRGDSILSRTHRLATARISRPTYGRTYGLPYGLSFDRYSPGHANAHAAGVSSRAPRTNSHSDELGTHISRDYVTVTIEPQTGLLQPAERRPN